MTSSIEQLMRLPKTCDGKPQKRISSRYFRKTFSRDELQALETFLQSPTGRKFATSLPTLDQELGSIAQKRIAVLRPQPQKTLTDWNEAHKAEIEAYSKGRK